MDLLTVTLLAATVVFLLAWFRRPDPRLPPCPIKPAPIIGHLLAVGTDPRQQYKQWREKVGDIFSLYMGSHLIVVFNGYKLLHDTLVKRADEFSDRPDMFIDEASGYPDKGVAFNSGEVWREQRAVTVKLLKQFGMGKNIIADKIQEEVSFYLDILGDSKGQPMDITWATYTSVSNNICSIIFGRRFEYDDLEFQKLMKAVSTTMSNLKMNSFMNFFPILRYLPVDFCKVNVVKQAIGEICQNAKRHVDSCNGKVPDAECDNLISAYIQEKNAHLKSGTATTMDDANLIKIVYELFIAGTETTSLVICWCVLYLLNYPDVQKKIYEEIKQEIGLDRPPNIQDKRRLPFLLAVTMETMRLASIVPHSLSHSCPRDVTVEGYLIPKGTTITPNLDSVLHDEKIWGEDVMRFRPDRFLDDDRKLKCPEEFVPFSLGRRICFGEALAYQELFLFMASMFQRFEFVPSDPGNPPSMNYLFGFTNSPVPYQVRIVERVQRGQ